MKQVYDLTEVNTDTGARTALGTNLPVAPANVGPRSTPNYEANLGSKAVTKVSGGITAFAGPRDDPFFVDLGSIFDLGGLRPFNQAHLIPLPKEPGRGLREGLQRPHLRPADPEEPPASPRRSGDRRLGHHLPASRADARRSRACSRSSGDWVQVARLGQPLVNEVVIPLALKDAFNGISPDVDADHPGAVHAVLNPELGRLIPVLYPGVKVPTNVDLGLGLGGREDLATIFLTGIPG